VKRRGFFFPGETDLTSRRQGRICRKPSKNRLIPVETPLCAMPKAASTSRKTDLASAAITGKDVLRQLNPISGLLKAFSWQLNAINWRRQTFSTLLNAFSCLLNRFSRLPKAISWLPKAISWLLKTIITLLKTIIWLLNAFSNASRWLKSRKNSEK